MVQGKVTLNFHQLVEYHASGQLQLAESGYRELLSKDPLHHGALCNLAVILATSKRFDEAIALFQKAIDINPQNPDPHFKLGKAYFESKQFDKAKAELQQAIQLNPHFYQAMYTLGEIASAENDTLAAIKHFGDVLKVQPHFGYALVQYWHLRKKLCDWHEWPKMLSAIKSQIKEQERNPKTPMISPFFLLAIKDCPLLQKKAARLYGQSKSTLTHPVTLNKAKRQRENNKIKIAYLSADFKEHATSYLMAELLELHDKTCFEFHAISYGLPTPEAPIYQRVKASFNHFHEVADLNDEAISALISKLKIDIAIDLKGYTLGARPAILKNRPATIQMQYLGYPGTMGMPYIDYLIADPYLIPPAYQHFYQEKIAYLPNCYQPSDNQRSVAQNIPSRAQCELPDNAFVFCCFNGLYKINPKMFDLWLSLLKRVDNSVLWLLKGHPRSEDNLLSYATSRGIDASRIIFAPPLATEKHLARIQQADLFLDTFPCNAHTTANDALFVGLPVITLSGRSFASRVAGSILNTLGLDELITKSPKDYEALAFSIATNPSMHKKLKATLKTAHQQSPLFNMKQYTKDLEVLFSKAYMNNRIGLPISHIDTVHDLTPKETNPDGCPLCGDVNSKKSPLNQRWFHCAHCHHDFTQEISPPTPLTIGDITERERFYTSKLMTHLLPYHQKGEWLDVNVENASLLLTAKEYGFKTIGCHTDKAHIDALRALHLDTRHTDFLKSELLVDVISFIMVLSKVRKVSDYLKKAYTSLNDNGVLIISEANTESALWQQLNEDKANPYWQDESFCQFFSKTNLYQLINKSGFKVLAFYVSETQLSAMDILAIKK